MAPTETLAEQHCATLEPLLAGRGDPVRAAHRRDAGGRGAARRSTGSRPASSALVVGTHALIEPDVEFARLAVVRRRRAAPLRRPPARRARRQGPRRRRAARPPHDRDADPAHALADRLRRPRRDRAARAARRAAGRSRPGWWARRSAPAPTSSSASGCARGARPSSSARSSPSRRSCRRRPPRPRPSASRAGELARLPGRAAARADAVGARRPRRWSASPPGAPTCSSRPRVIEVGIDVANATVMLIEGAERYGLSQLHQLRGPGRPRRARVAMHPLRRPRVASSRRRRLEAIATERDGFELAEVDLTLRGEGEILGTRQHGLPRFRVAELPEDAPLLAAARAEVHRAARAPRHRSTRPSSARCSTRPARASATSGSSGSPREGGRADELGGRHAESPPGRVDARCGRPPTASARRCSRSSATSRTCACSTSSAAPARWRSRRSRAAPTRRRWSTATPALARRNVEELGLGDRCERRPLATRSASSSAASERFDLVLCDPPYRLAAALSPSSTNSCRRVSPDDARLVVESSARRPLALDAPSCRCSTSAATARR